MSILRAQRAITALRELGPYVLLEILLPGGTLVALLLWLSQRYMGGRLGSVRQYSFQKVAKPAAAIARFGRSALCALLLRTVAGRLVTLAPCSCPRPAVTL
jgi:hypothetical protein